MCIFCIVMGSFYISNFVIILKQLFTSPSANNKGLLTEREVCTVKYRTAVFSTDRAVGEVCTKNQGPIFHCTDRTSDVNKLFII